MDSFEFNKIAGAVLASLLVLLGIGMFLVPVLYAPTEYDAQAYIVEGVEEAGGNSAAAEVAEETTIEELISLATVERGQKVARRCVACHTFEDGGDNKIGPNLWNVMGETKGQRDGFNYSGALLEKGGEWDWTAMDAFLAKPADYIPGTAMSFAGLGKEEDRAAVMVYLASLAGTPYAKPAFEAAVEEAAVEEAVVEEAAAASVEEAEAAVTQAVEEAADEGADDLPGRRNPNN